jgi:transcriptional regulator with XRE-family HTH domain
MLYDNDKINALRLAAKLSGNELARKAGISGPSMHAILKGTTKEVKFSTLTGIALALGVPVQAISKGRGFKGKRDIQAEVMSAFSRLSPEDQEAMLAAIQHLGRK